MAKINFLIRKIIVSLIQAYRYFLSPILGNCCRFYPSCSIYSATAIERFGFLKGSFMALKRILSCHPWHNHFGGYDPVPETFSVKKPLITD